MKAPSPVTAIVAGGTAEAVERTLATLAGQSRVPDVWLLQAPRDDGIDRLVAECSTMTVRVVRADRPFSPWAPLTFAWFVPSACVLLTAGGVVLAPHFVAVAYTTLLRRRGAVCSAGGAARTQELGAEAAAAAIDAGACLMATEWVRHAWALPPGDLTRSPGPHLAAGLGKAGIPIFVAGEPAG